MGVWIETEERKEERCGDLVTPFVGVWIETVLSALKSANYTVTPFVGVWIETISWTASLESTMCHTLRGCVD